MDTSVLQQKLAAQRHLLPSQHELLNRLLFQLAFNDFQNIGLVGAEGSGKSTLALALAELFSELANVALINGSVPESELEKQLQQHWFGKRQAEPSLAAMMAEPVAGALPLVLIVDNFNLLSSSARKQLLQLDCLGFYMLAEPCADMALNLSINIPTLQDAGQVLKEKALDPLAVAERFAASRGNMHLLHSAIVKPEERKSHSAAIWLLPAAMALLVVAAGMYWLFPGSADKTAQNYPVNNELTQPDSTRVEIPEQANTLLPVENPISEDSSEPADSPEPTNSLERTNNTEPDVSSADHTAATELPVSIELAGQTEVTMTGESYSEQSTSELTTTEAAVGESATPEQPAIDRQSELVESEERLIQGIANEPAAKQAGALYQEQKLLELSPDFRLLQLAVLSSETALERFIQAYPDTDIMVYRRSWQGKLQWIILVDQYYPDVSSARQARALLPEPLRAAGPFIKPVGQAQQEIKALARSRAEAELQD
ncbi:hypothetical protein [Arsukibacterium indicum]|uniref:AAA+ ATPase domain-containing protein n=1 Tax=Arsukibacterium indicum TaxID=2848612 RepID=A0ABS6MNT9_9GAMM|nr:hypothetical protein [Arsukibacterium indicum]MBV2130039.1 hypothetical protein [Arsukibacterium indicum]